MQNLFVLYATAKSEIKICSNKHETGLVFLQNRDGYHFAFLSTLTNTDVNSKIMHQLYNVRMRHLCV